MIPKLFTRILTGDGMSGIFALRSAINLEKLTFLCQIGITGVGEMRINK